MPEETLIELTADSRTGVSESATKPNVALPVDAISIKQVMAQVIPEVESTLIKRALRLTGNNRTRAATLLEISHRSLLYKIKNYNCG